MLSVGNALILTIPDAVLVASEQGSVAKTLQVAVYIPAVFTVVLVPTNPLLQVTVPFVQPVAVSVPIFPWHNDKLLTEILGATALLQQGVTLMIALWSDCACPEFFAITK